ncbi:MAG TPA: prepilin peptidase [Gemmatimonadaceae bacterium]
MIAPTLIELVAYAFVFLVGACIGSFLNVCIARWPAQLSVVAPRSRCPSCGHAIAWYENIPLLSWLVLRGRCRGCRGAISPIYPAVELLVAIGWLAAVVAFGFGFTALRIAVFGTVLLGVSITDAKHYVIPDGFTVFGFVWVIVTAFVGQLIGEILPFAGAGDAILGACVGAGAIAIAGWLGEVAFKKEAMGFGDATLMAVVGGALGPWRALLTVFVAAFLGAALFLLVVYPISWLRARRTQQEFAPPMVPFGVFLAPAALVTLLWGSALIAWYAEQLPLP